MGAAALHFAWESTPLGPVSTWDQSLRQAARTCLSTQFPMMIAWGPELTVIYNDAYRDMLGTHTRLTALGAPMREVWEDAWDDIDPVLMDVMTTHHPSWSVDAPRTMNRSGYTEETYFTFSYSPLYDDGGRVVGIMDIAAETTDQVVARRRLSTIDVLHVRLQDTAHSPSQLASTAVDVLHASRDVDLCAVYLRTPDGFDLAAASPYIGDLGIQDDLISGVLVSAEPAVYADSIYLPLGVQDTVHPDGVLVVQAPPTRPFDAGYRSFAMLAGSALAGALRSAKAQQAQLDASEAMAQLSQMQTDRARHASVTLQQSLLTSPPEPDHLHVVVRYQPAGQDLEVGGDWYDSFVTKDGATTLVIGDVTGHDSHAAAAMGQIRGIIRTIAYDSGATPATVLERTDQAIRGLNLGPAATATCVVARIERPAEDHGEGARVLRWTNAGHPYPVLIRADGTTEVLNRGNDLLLGVLTGPTRHDHTVPLHDGDTLLLYTDGLTERRGKPLSVSTRILLDALTNTHTTPLEELATHILTTLAPARTADDVAMVLVRLYPEDQPRPPEAGPRVNVPQP